MPDLGRFFNVDPLSEKYTHNSTYAFSENKLLAFIELEGLEAWESTNNWDEQTIQRFREFASQWAEEYKNDGTNCTCEDLAFNILIDFAYANELPVILNNSDGTLTFDSSSEEFNDVGEFKEEALSSLGAIDVLVNSESIPLSQLQVGDNLFDSQVGHVQVVTEITADEIEIHQGNVGFGWSANPSSAGYVGVDVQTGRFDKATGDYKRDNSSNPGIKNYLDTLSKLVWDFYSWNSYQNNENSNNENGNN